MKPISVLSRLLAVSALGLLLGGCLFKPAKVTTRRFVLTPVPAASRAGPVSQQTLGLGAVQMPAYLLKSSMAVRRGEHEIEYLENALWAEPLNQSFQRALAANLSVHLPEARIQSSAWRRGQVAVVARVRVDRLDVDTQGLGKLIASWQIESPDPPRTLTSGQTMLTQSGPPPYSDPASVATTLSELTAQFSEALARAIRESAPAGFPQP